jgi:tetratricopeptide (TPR) repeat protein
MYNKEIKIGLAALLFGLSVYQFILVNIGWGILLLLLTGLVVLTIYRHEGIIMALYHLRKQDVTKAEAALNRIKAPEKLIKTQEAYYYYLQGLIGMQQKGIGKSEKFFVKALNLGLRLKEDQAVAKLNLAGIYMSKRKKREAEQYLNQAKKLDSKKLLDDQIKMLRAQLGRI